MHIDVLTLFPEMFNGVLDTSILKRAQEQRAFTYELINFRTFSQNKHQKVDDYPYGGGAGMILTPQPIFDAVDYARNKRETTPRIILLCPQGERYTQAKAEEFAKENHLILICGHYEGYDERIRQYLVTDEISLGDFVLTGGEIAAMAIIDSVVRLLPGVLGNKVSKEDDSFTTGLLEHPHYTRPADYKGMRVPNVLLEGHHAKIARWRMKESLRRTLLRRPDLLAQINLTEEQKALLQEIKAELTAEENGSS